MATRRQVRQTVVSLLYASEFNELGNDFIEEFLEQNKIRNEQKNFALELLNGINANLQSLDEKLVLYMKEADKISKIERAILRLSAYEFLHTKTDKAVIINEAIELSKTLASENSPKFVNAVLDGLQKGLK